MTSKKKWKTSANTCSIKKAFNSKEEALTHIQFLKATPSEYRKRKVKGVYVCNICGKWHTTKKAVNVKKRDYDNKRSVATGLDALIK